MSEAEFPTHLDHKKELSEKDLEKEMLFNYLSRDYNRGSEAVIIPKQYQDYLSGQETLPEDDFRFIDTLLRRYGVIKDPESREPAPPFDRTAFFAAAHEVRGYTERLRQRLDDKFYETSVDPEINVTTPDGILALALFALTERERPSSNRAQDLCYLFLHVPKVRKVYLQIHAEKMSDALPVLDQTLTTVPTVAETRDEFFTDMKDTMLDVMESIVDADDEDMQTLGLVMGYASNGYRLPDSILIHHFSAAGVPTFVTFLEQVTKEAINLHEDLFDRMQREFMHPESVGYRSMRVSGIDAKHLKDESKKQVELAVARQKFSEIVFHSGACPAIQKVTSEGTRGERPIALEYAMTILRHMPPELLR